jgi:3-hydroxybutyryl-CoA dehydrogenase
LLVLLIVPLSHAEESGLKQQSVFYPARLIENARRNVCQYDWARQIRDSVVQQAEPWIGLSDEQLWGLMFGPAITRSWMVWSDGHCPSCENAVPMYNWEMAAMQRPWKTRCPQRREIFPKNDFDKFYSSGLDQHGVSYRAIKCDEPVSAWRNCEMTEMESNQEADARLLGMPVGVVGLGLMGRGIAACLLARGFQVIGYNRTTSRAEESVEHIAEALREMHERGLVKAAAIDDWQRRYQLVGTLDQMAPCGIIVESVREDLSLKRQVFDALEAVVRVETVIGSNTSSIPITVLQQGRKRPERFIGMHWGEPVQVSRYLEITCGRQTSPRAIRLARRIGEVCAKDPTLLKRDIRGFLSNRMMYAMMREAFYLVEQGIADLDDVDRSFRNDIGWWATIAGPFRWMDLTGIPAYAAVAEDLFPELCNSSEVPSLLRAMVESGAQGVANQKGFYEYSEASAEEWSQAWVDFSYDLNQLVEKYNNRLKLSGRREV